MRKLLKTALFVALALILASGTAFAQAKYHIGIVTGTVSQSEDDLRGAEALIKAYGSVKDGGLIQHITYPDDFMSQQETFISQVVSLADDAKMKAIIIQQAIPGTTEAFKRVKAKRPDILLLAGEPHEDPLVIQSAADLAVSADFVSRGYTIVWAAKQLGAKKFVHISFPRHMSYESLGRRRAIMEQACKDLGLEFYFETAPDPTSDVGMPGAQQFIMEKTPQWIQKYGKATAFFCTNDGETEPLLRQMLAYGGIFVEADLPSPLMGYPGALGIDLSKEMGNFPAILAKVEEAVVAKGGAGRFGTWAFSYGYTLSAGLGEFAKNVIDGKAKKDSLKDLFAAMGKYTPGAKWNGAYYTDMNTGVRAKNQVLVYMDTYIMGGSKANPKKGYFLPTTQQKVPEKYYTIKK
jgi:ABC-type sugar transport system substrate-binding protein